jgi:antirestriction protein ArdC
VSADDFRLPWHRSGASIQPRNALTKNAYRGINIVSLWIAAEVRGYPHALWASYKQWQELGTQVRKDERSSLVVFFKEYDVEPDPQVEDDDGKRRVARHSSVFNVAQVDNFALPDAPQTSFIERDQAADAFFAATKADIWHGGERAYYHTRDDFIQMPDEGRFRGSQYGTPTEDYFCVLAHEATHWTSHRARSSWSQRRTTDTDTSRSRRHSYRCGFARDIAALRERLATDMRRRTDRSQLSDPMVWCRSWW